MQIEACYDQGQWDEYVHEHGGHPLQLWGWGEVKAAHGWHAYRYTMTRGDTIVGCAQVLVRPLPWPFRRFIYVPRGPVFDAADQDEVLAALAKHIKGHLKGVVLSIEPPRTESPMGQGWRRSSNTILIPHTLILDLRRSQDELMEAMSKKTRQYIRKSAKEPLTIRRVTSREMLADLMALYHQTASRAGFPLHEDQYYYDVFDKLGEASVIFAATNEQGPIAFVWLAVSAGTAFELYGCMMPKGKGYPPRKPVKKPQRR